MIEDHIGMYLVLIPHCMTEILAKECKSGKSTVLALGTVLETEPFESAWVFIIRKCRNAAGSAGQSTQKRMLCIHFGSV